MNKKQTLRAVRALEIRYKNCIEKLRSEMNFGHLSPQTLQLV